MYDPIKRREEYLRNIEYYKAYNKKLVGLEKTKQLSKESYHRRKTDPNNIIKFLLKNAKARATKKNLEFSLVATDITLPDLCPYLKVKFDKNSRRYGYSIDRIDSTKGYTKDNIQIISQLANAMKWDSTQEELIQFAKSVLKIGGDS